LTAGAEPTQPLTKAQKLDMQMALARISENDGNLDDAIKNYSDVLQKDGNRAEACHRIAILYDMKGQPEKSRSYYLQAIKKVPDNAELYCDFGYSCYLQRNWAEADKNLRKAIELNPELARAHVNLGMLLARTHRASAALNEFARAGLGEAAARSNLALADVQEERWMEAQEEYARALSADPNSKSAKMGLAALQSQNFNTTSPAVQITSPVRMPPAVQPQNTLAIQTPAPPAVQPEPQIAAPPQAPPAMPIQAPVVAQNPAPPAVSPEPQYAAQPQPLPSPASGYPAAPVVQELPKPQPEPQLAAKPQALPAVVQTVASPKIESGPQLAEQSQVQAPPTEVPLQTPADIRPEPRTTEQPPAVAQVPPAQQEPRTIAPPQPLPPVQAASVAGRAESPADQAEPQPEVRPLPPPTEQAEAPASAPSQAPDVDAAPVPPVRPPVETALRGPEETSPDTRRY
jgi:Tfp pilus assembly protein PilF